MLTVNCSVLVPGNSEDGHTSSDDDGEPFTSGLMSVLRGYTNAPKASAKAPAKRASAPKVAPKASQAKSRASTPASGTPSGISMKCPIGMAPRRNERLNQQRLHQDFLCQMRCVMLTGRFLRDFNRGWMIFVWSSLLCQSHSLRRTSAT